MLADEDVGFNVCCILLAVFWSSVFGTGSVVSSSEDGTSKTSKSAGCVAETFAGFFFVVLKVSPDFLCGLGAARMGGIACVAAFGFAAGRCTAFAFVLSCGVLCVTWGVFARRSPGTAVPFEDEICVWACLCDTIGFAGSFAAGATGFAASGLRNDWAVLEALGFGPWALLFCVVPVSFPDIRLFAGGLLMGFGGGGANSSSEGTSNMSGLLVAARMLSSAPAAFVFPPIPFKAPLGFVTGFGCSSGSGASSLSWGVEMEGRADLP
jgi:hypothetical protein